MRGSILTRRPRMFVAFAVAALLAGCRREPAFSELASEFVYRTLSFSPWLASQMGLHVFADAASGDTLRLDALLDDFSPAALTRQREYLLGFRRRLNDVDRGRLDAQSQADYDLLSDGVALALFNLDQERFHERKPQMYAEVLGILLFNSINREYADTAKRAADLTARVGQIPVFIDGAVANLKESNETFRRVALGEMEGPTELVRDAGARFVKGTPSETAYAAVQPAALAAIERFNAFVRDSLPRLGAFDWRMGREMFETKWRYYLQSSITPAEMVKSAEDSIVAIRAQMLALAMPLHSDWFPGHRHRGDDTTALTNGVVGEVLARIGDEHTHRDSLEAQAKKDVKTLEDFVRERRVLSLNDFSKFTVIPTPVFMRGSFGVAGAMFAPPLEPKLSAFYWVTPIPSEWSGERADAKLREYNHYKMLSLSIHEAVPGHLVQFEYSNRVTPEWRRVLRLVFGSNANLEGWGVYAEHMMEQLGVNGGDSVKTRLTALKAMLRTYSNSIIDIRLHTQNMPADSVVPFLTREAFQEEPEATAKLQRAQLDYVQLNLYAVGLHDWWALRRDAERREGSAFNLCRYHDTVLSYGAVPGPTVRRLYFDHAASVGDMPASRCNATD